MLPRILRRAATPLIAALTFTLLAAIPIITATAQAATNNTSGSREVDTLIPRWSQTWTGIRSARAQIYYEGDANTGGVWSPPSGSFVLSSVDVEPSSTTLLQMGYLKVASNVAFDDCGGNGQGSGGPIGVIVEWEIGGNYHCQWYDPTGGIQIGDSATFTVARCGGDGLWCAYYNGNQIGSAHNLGPNTSSHALVGMEQATNTIEGGAQVIIGPNHPMALANLGHDSNPTWYTVIGSDTCILNNGNGNFTVGDMGPTGTTFWTVAQGNGTASSGC